MLKVKSCIPASEACGSFLTTKTEEKFDSPQDQRHTGLSPLSGHHQYRSIKLVEKYIHERPSCTSRRKPIENYYIKPTSDHFHNMDHFMQYAQSKSARSKSRTINFNRPDYNQLLPYLCCFSGLRSGLRAGNQQIKRNFYDLLVDQCRNTLSDNGLETNSINEAENIVNDIFTFSKINQSISEPLALVQVINSNYMSKVYTLTYISFLRTDISQLKRSVQQLDACIIKLDTLYHQSGNDKLIRLISDAKNSVTKSLRLLIFDVDISLELKKIFKNQHNTDVYDCNHHEIKIPEYTNLQLTKQTSTNLSLLRSLKDDTSRFLINMAYQENIQTGPESLIRTIPVSILNDMLGQISLPADDKKSDIRLYYDQAKSNLDRIENDEKKSKKKVDNLFSALFSAVRLSTCGQFIKLWLAVEIFSPCFCLNRNKQGGYELAINAVFLTYSPQAALDEINLILSGLDVHSDWYQCIKSTFNSNQTGLYEYVFDWNSQNKIISFTQESSETLFDIQNRINLIKKLFLQDLRNIISEISMRNYNEYLPAYKNRVIATLNSLIKDKQSRLSAQAVVDNLSLAAAKKETSSPEPTASSAIAFESRTEVKSDQRADTKKVHSDFFKKLRNVKTKKTPHNLKDNLKDNVKKAGHHMKQFLSVMQGHANQLAHADDDFGKINAVCKQINTIAYASTVQEVRNLVQELIDINLFKNEERKAQLHGLLKLSE